MNMNCERFFYFYVTEPQGRFEIDFDVFSCTVFVTNVHIYIYIFQLENECRIIIKIKVDKSLHLSIDNMTQKAKFISFDCPQQLVEVS